MELSINNKDKIFKYITGFTKPKLMPYFFIVFLLMICYNKENG